MTNRRPQLRLFAVTDSDRDSSQNVSGYSLRDSVRQRRFKRMLPIGILVAIAFVVTVLFFLITNIQIVVTPDHASARKNLSRVSGALITWGDDVLMLGNRGTVEVSSPGYVDVEVVIDTGDPSPFRNIPMDPLPGIVTIHVDAPKPFTLDIDGARESSDSEMIKTELERGKHLVTLAGRSIQSETTEIEVEGYGRAQEFHLIGTTSNSFVALSTEPQSARIFLDGIDVGIGSFEGRVSTGSHQLELRAEGHSPEVLQLEVGNEETVELGRIALQPLMATLRVQSEPSAAAVIVDGEFAGSTPVAVSLTPNIDHDLIVRKQTYDPVQTTIQLQPGANATRRFRLNVATTQIEIQSNVLAEVRLNAKVAGATPINLEIKDGDVIEVFKEGYASQSRRIDSIDGVKPTMKFNLLTERESVYQNAPNEITVIGTLKLAKFPVATVRMSIPSEMGSASTPSVRAFELTRPFYMGIHEVTNSEFEKFNSQASASNRPGNHPVQNLSWNAAIEFCNWLSAQEGFEPAYYMDQTTGDYKLNEKSTAYRLPTEAEWEAVATYDYRSGRQLGPFPWGDSQRIPRGVGNFAGREVLKNQLPFLSSYVDNHAESAPVGSYASNMNGIHDLAGNISEWVHDYYAGRDFGVNTNQIDPLGPNEGLDHVVKGANFRSSRLEDLYTHLRKVKTNSSPEVGFRVARWIY